MGPARYTKATTYTDDHHGHHGARHTMSGGWHRTTPRPDRNSWQWQQARQAALARDGHQCRAMHQSTGTNTRCTAQATEVDHINQGNDHSLDGLVSLCTEHHKQKTQQEATAARWRYRQKRTPEKHPGLI